MEKELSCISCGTGITNIRGGTHFPCPSCGKHTMIRCRHCREIAKKYTCPECGFEGPN